MGLDFRCVRFAIAASLYEQIVAVYRKRGRYEDSIHQMEIASAINHELWKE
jgi:hypothetical protein